MILEIFLVDLKSGFGFENGSHVDRENEMRTSRTVSISLKCSLSSRPPVVTTSQLLVPHPKPEGEGLNDPTLLSPQLFLPLPIGDLERFPCQKAGGGVGRGGGCSALRASSLQRLTFKAAPGHRTAPARQVFPDLPDRGAGLAQDPQPNLRA